MFQTLKNLPRDARDTLFLLIVIAWTVAPQVNHLPLWCSAMTATVLVWRGWIAVRAKPLPSRWWLVALLILAGAGTFYSHSTILGRDAGVTFIVVLLALKTLEMRAQRDAFVIFFLGFFTLLSNFFFSQGLLTAAAMLVSLLGLLTAVVNSHMPVGRPSLWVAARTAGWMALLGAPIMAVLFMVFPRIAPLWGVPGDAMSGRSGLSNHMQIGAVASLALDSSVAMRVKFDGPIPQRNTLYFRGPVLSNFDGREWTQLQTNFARRHPEQPQLQVQGTGISYAVILSGANQTWVPVLDASTTGPAIPGYKSVLGPELEWTSEPPINDLVRYTATSFTQFRHGPQQWTAALQNYVDLPYGYNPRTLQLARQMQQEVGRDPAELVKAAMERLRTGGYTYTLDPGTYGRNTADEFWFDRKQGFCEHAASSFVILMRAMEIPARVVTGYQGGETNTFDGLWTVRQSDAHAWTEVWLSGQGWTRVDPTSALAPGRVGTSQRLVAPANALSLALGTVNPQLLQTLRAAWDAMNNRWNQWILNYNQSKQMDLLRNLGFQAPSWEDLGYLLATLVGLTGLFGAIWTQFEKLRHDPWLRLLHTAAQRLQRAGLALEPQAPPRTLLAALKKQPAVEPKVLAQLQDWLLRLEAWRYAPKTTQSRASLRQLQRECKTLPWPTHFAVQAATD